jgi:hypothetical protein
VEKKESLKQWLDNDSMVPGEFEVVEERIYQELENEIENKYKPPKCNGLRKIMRAEWFYSNSYVKELFPAVKK